MKAARLHIAAAYGAAILLIAAPFSEVMFSVLPMTPSAAEWRFAAITIGSRALLTPIIGLLLLTGLAVYTENRKVLLGAGFILLTGSLLLFVSSGAFVLDALEMRNAVLPENRTSYDYLNAPVLLKLALGTIVSAMLGWGSLRSAALLKPSSRRRSTESALVR